jgi:predicted nucleic acid-binding protein
MSDVAARVVVDSSVVVKWFLRDGESDVEEACRLRDGHLAGDPILAAPSHLMLEVLNALRSRGLDSSDMQLAARWLVGMRLETVPVEVLAVRAAAISAEHGLTVYDAAFVALAESLDAELVTADRRLAACPACRTRLLGEGGIDV